MRSSDYSASISNYFDSTNHNETSDANVFQSMFQLGAESNLIALPNLAG
jgi:hypothetical protein